MDDIVKKGSIVAFSLIAVATIGSNFKISETLVASVANGLIVGVCIGGPIMWFHRDRNIESQHQKKPP